MAFPFGSNKHMFLFSHATRRRNGDRDSDLLQTKGRIFITSQEASKEAQSQTAKPTLKTESATVAYRPTYGAQTSKQKTVGCLA